MSQLSIDFQTLYALRGSPRYQGRRRYISCNIGMHFKVKGEWRHGNEYSTQTLKKSTFFSGQYLCNRSTMDVGVLGYIGIVWPKEHSLEVCSVPPVTPCIEEARCLKFKDIWVAVCHMLENLSSCECLCTTAECQSNDEIYAKWKTTEVTIRRFRIRSIKAQLVTNDDDDDDDDDVFLFTLSNL